MKYIVYFYLICLSIQDIKTYYISKRWMFLSLIIFLLPAKYSIATALVFGLPCGFFYKTKRWMGSMDVYFVTLFGFILGWQRMIICMYVSIFLGFLWFVFSKKKLCPFLACLSLGFILAFEKGYTIYYICLQMIKG